MIETDVVNSITKALKEIGGFIFKVHGGMFQRRGIPDILYWKDGVSYAFEVKLPDERHPVSKLQDLRLKELKAQGVVIGVVHSAEETLDIVHSKQSNYPRD
jgi:hypothetical protein